MEGHDRTLAAIVEGGWRLTFYCAGCRKPLVTYDSEGLLDRFGAAVSATEADVCARIRCEACGGRGAWTSCVEGANVSTEFDREDGYTLWQQRDLRLRRLLHERGLPLEIADERWAAVEAQLSYYPTWAPRVGASLRYPLSPAGEASVREREKA